MTGEIAQKFDTHKPRPELLPADALLAVSDVLAFGARKYGDRNWERGLKQMRLYAAAQRHLLAWSNGDNYDGESGLLHLAHAACCVLMLLATALRYPGLDDRQVT